MTPRTLRGRIPAGPLHRVARGGAALAPRRRRPPHGKTIALESDSARPLEGPPSSVHRLFVYDTSLAGEPEHALLRGAELAAVAMTEAAFDFVDLGAYAALVPGGKTAVHGEVYVVDRITCIAFDVRREVPRLFQRSAVHLADWSVVEAHVLSPDQVRGRRRIASGDWRTRFASPVVRAPHPWTDWARGRRRPKSPRRGRAAFALRRRRHARTASNQW